MREVKLESGATLKIYPSTFGDARKLFKVMVAEAQKLEVLSLTPEQMLESLWKNTLASDAVEQAVQACLVSCVYFRPGQKELKVDEDTFRDQATWSDFLPVCYEVVKENVLPFMKGLSVGFGKMLAEAPKSDTPK